MTRHILFIAAASLLGCACGAGRPGTAASVPAAETAIVTSGPGAQALPRAVIYKMTGPYALNVPVTLKADGGLLSFPDPRDIRNTQPPVQVAGGYWLDTRGVSDASVFTRWTYAQYAALARVPSVKEIMDSIIPGARVVGARMLPMTPSEALADTAAVNAMIRRGL